MKLQGQVAVVTGASRGVGRGIAVALGAEGATVYVTGRTVDSGVAPLPGTIGETAQEVTQQGGRGIAVRCDHDNDDDVKALFQQIKEEQGRLDILVNNVFAVPDGPLFNTPFWEQPIDFWDKMHRIGLRSHYIASSFAAPLMIPQGKGLIANISSFGGGSYQLNVAYGVGKAGVDRLASDMAHDLRPHNIASVSLWPGIVRTERLLASGDELPFDMSNSESPEFTGRAIAALATDPNLMKRTGNVWVVAELAQEYGFTDTDNSQPKSLRRKKSDVHRLVKKSQGLLSRCKELADTHEAQRRVDPSLVQELAKLGMFRMLVPRDLGGGEVKPDVFVQVLETLAQGDGATAWCVMTGATTGVLSAYMTAQGAQELWGQQPDAVMAGIFAPMGKATPVEGGYQLTGRWPFASGCENSTWHMGGAMVMEDGKPRTGPDGAPLIYSMFFPSEKSEVIDTWSVSGLRGTGSHDIAVKDLFIPTHHATILVGQEPHHKGTLYTFPAFGLLAAGIAGVALGIAHASIQALKELATQKKGFGSRRTLAQQELTQLQVAQAEAERQAAYSFLTTTLTDTWKHAKQNGSITDQDKARVRMAATHATTAAVRVVDAMYHLGGGSSIYQTSPLQRHFRDIHTLTQHVMVSPRIMTTVGKVLLNLDVNTAQL